MLSENFYIYFNCFRHRFNICKATKYNISSSNAIKYIKQWLGNYSFDSWDCSLHSSHSSKRQISKHVIVYYWLFYGKLFNDSYWSISLLKSRCKNTWELGRTSTIKLSNYLRLVSVNQVEDSIITYTLHIIIEFSVFR